MLYKLLVYFSYKVYLFMVQYNILFFNGRFGYFFKHFFYNEVVTYLQYFIVFNLHYLL